MKIKNFNSVILIGFGELLIHTYKILKKNDLNLLVVISKRHAKTNLPLKKINFEKYIVSEKINYIKIDNINKNKKFINFLQNNKCIGLCFGPSWIFSSKVINLFKNNIFNFNGIPIPEYLGGAHYTWQILNNNKKSGKFIQIITEDIDQGDIIYSKISKLKNNVTKPEDYFKENIESSKKFINNFFHKISNSNNFKKISFNKINYKRLYFPRLLTNFNGYINWNWKTDDIIKFANSFDEPYSGALTFLKNKKVKIKNLKKLNQSFSFHPYCNGLIVRNWKNTIYICTVDGLVYTDQILNQKNLNIIKDIKEGTRLITPNNILEKSMINTRKLD